MSDIVEKLRSQIGDDVSHVYDKEALFREAAIEIMHLRAACAEWAEVSQRNYQRAKAAEAEIERLRDALTLAANRLHRCAVDYDTGSREFFETGEWAREALAALAADSGAADA